MRKGKILLLTDCLIDPEAGGAERKVFDLAKGLDKSKYDVILGTLDCEGSTPENIVKEMGASLVVFRVKRIYGLSGLIQGFKFMRFLKSNQVDVIQTYHFSSDIWGTFYGWLAGVKLIVSNRRDMGFWRKSWHVMAYKCVNRLVKQMIVVSTAVKKVLIETEGVKEEKIQVIFNGVSNDALDNVADLNELRDSLQISKDDLVIVHVANFKRVKGHIYLLEAMRDVVSKFANVKLLLIGEDEFEGELQMKAKDFLIDKNILFLGKRDDVSSLLCLADICVLPSLSEGMSNAILEYMAAAKPVIATRVGGNPENVIDGQTGYLIEPKNSQSLAEAINKLLSDQALRESFGAKGRDRVGEVFSLKEMINKYEEFYDRLLAF